MQITRLIQSKTIQTVGLVAIMSAFHAPAVNASGSEGFGGAATGAAQLYNSGKRILVKKIICKSCILPGKKINKEEAKRLLEGKGDAEKIQSILSENEQQALATYLTRRYKL